MGCALVYIQMSSAYEAVSYERNWFVLVSAVALIGYWAFDKYTDEVEEPEDESSDEAPDLLPKGASQTQLWKVNGNAGKPK